MKSQISICCLQCNIEMRVTELAFAFLAYESKFKGAFNKSHHCSGTLQCHKMIIMCSPIIRHFCNATVKN